MESKAIGIEKKKFWHICEVCGKKEFITSEQAYLDGWDYPPRMGMFGVLSARICSDCPLEETLWWKVAIDQNFDFKNLSGKDTETLKRIQNEPFSLMGE